MKRILIAFCTLVLLSACSKNDDTKETPKPADRTVLIYIAGENTLNVVVPYDLNEIKEGSKSIGNNNLVVYVDKSSSELPWLARFKDGQVVDSVSIADMGISTKDEYTSNPAVMEDVIKYAFNKYPATTDYGLVLWGHSTGWIIEDSIPYNRRGYGVDNGHNTSGNNDGPWINIPTLSEVLSKTKHLKFIFADCCNFMCLESAYELRNVTDYIIGSPAEIPGSGAPYHTVVPAMFESSSFYSSIVDRYFEQVINDKKVPLSVIKTSAMNDVANATRTVLQSVKANIGDAYADMTGRIHYYNVGSSYNTFKPQCNIFFDAGDFLQTYAPAADYANWKQALDKAVIMKRMATTWNTDKPWNTHYSDFEMTEERYSGVSMFVPQDPSGYDYGHYNDNIRKLSWYYAAGLQEIGW